MNYTDIAMLINASYYDIQPEDFISKRQEIEDIWSKISQEDKNSSIEQAKDIENKLLYLCLDMVSSANDIKSLIEKNCKLFNQKLPTFQVNKKKIKEFKVSDFPTNFEDPVDNLASMEHDRWVKYHTLKGWRYNPQKDKSKKLHNCLLPLSKFDTEARLTYKYDLIAIINIPYYLAFVGMKIILL
jgi:hypothetical protein